MGSIVEALRHTPRDTGLDMSAIRNLSNYWEKVRAHYLALKAARPHLRQKFICMKCQADNSPI